MRKPLLEVLADRILVGDGAMGTFLIQEGLSSGEGPEEWNASHGEIVQQVHSVYFQAGSDLVLTNTFGGNRIKLACYGLADRLEELNRRAVELARAAAGDDKYVLGDIGPCGGLLEPYGDLAKTEAEEAFVQQTEALVSCDVDGIIIETMPDLEEMKTALRAVKRVTQLPVLTSITFQNGQGKDGHRTFMGQSSTECASQLQSLGADIVGTNCGVGSREMVEIIGEMASACPGIRLIAQPNAGLPIVESGETVYPETPKQMAECVDSFLKAGVRILGACCGSSPDHIRAIRASVDALGN